ncbi:FecR family protein [Cerasicoccus frondis]|uniref:FecR family protein n=1 Tax=Cerasicoccus frondis TaxID=490090 RepID=UPI002852A9FB|nr:FecR domain-containing protein [Cerasicoccus frondis]
MKILKLITLAATVLCLANVASAQEKIGVIKAFLVKGQVQLVNNATGAVTPLKRGQEFSEGNTVVTGDNSTALLLFSNGASINVTPNSKFDVTTFEQASYDPALGSFLRLEKDPSLSTTNTSLGYGQIIGEVRKLDLDAGSSFTINTPVASAGIRGTVWVVEYNAETGEFSSTNITGDVVVVLADGTVVPVAEGETYTILNINDPGSSAPASPEVLAKANQFVATLPNAPAISTVTNHSTIVTTPEMTIISTGTGVDPSGSVPIETTETTEEETNDGGVTITTGSLDSIGA